MGNTFSFNRALVAVFVALALAACGETEGESGPETTRVVLDDASSDAEDGQAADAASEAPPEEALAALAEATPMAERVATIGLLNKRNNVSRDFEMKPGETIEEGPVTIRLEACERTAPYEFPQETGAFVQVDVMERRQTTRTRVFSGWLFKDSSSLNVVEHPIYDVWVKDCAMRFPGEE